MSSISPMRTPERRLLSFLGDGEPPERKPEGGAMTRLLRVRRASRAASDFCLAKALCKLAASWCALSREMRYSSSCWLQLVYALYLSLIHI